MKNRLEHTPRADDDIYISVKCPPAIAERYLNAPKGPAPRISDDAIIRDSILGPWTMVGDRCHLNEVQFGAWSYIVSDASANYATIGKFCSLAQGVTINPGNHPHWRAAMHHFSYRSSSYELADNEDETFFEWRRGDKVTIGHDVWCGHGAIILAGNKIGDGAIIAAGAVVTKDVPPFTIVGGAPARVIRSRFSAATQDALTEIAWWDWPHEKIKVHLSDFRTLDAEAFVDKHRL